jgi:alkanesulfonate monooxygenase SsuD/methylene tetrahydromethanopterin reductase-like flavin-dependent oxidoreductase (luciferase family)
LHPKAHRRPPTVLIGGSGETDASLVAKYAGEWNAVSLSADTYAAKVKVLRAAPILAGRHHRALDDDLRGHRPDAASLTARRNG